MSAIQSGAPHHLLQIAVDTLPQLPLLLNPAFLAAVLPVAVAPLFIRSAGNGAEAKGGNETAPTAETDSTGS